MKHSRTILQSRKLLLKNSSRIRNLNSVYWHPSYRFGLSSLGVPNFRALATSHEEALKVTERNTTDILGFARKSLSNSLNKALEREDWEQALRLVCSVPGKATFQPEELDRIPYERLSPSQLQQLSTAYDYILQRSNSSSFSAVSVERALNIYRAVKDPEKAIRILSIVGSSATPEMGLQVLQVCTDADSVSSIFQCFEKLVDCGVVPEREHIQLACSVLEKKEKEPYIKNLLELVDRAGTSMDILLYNSFMFSSFQARRYKDVMEFLRKMNRFQLTPNEYSYSLYLAAWIVRNKFRQGFQQLENWESRGVFTLCPTLFLVMGEVASDLAQMENVVTFHGDIVKSGRQLDLECSNCLATFASFHGHVYQSFRTWRHRREHSLAFDTNSLNAILLGCVKSRRFDLAEVAWDSFARYGIQRDSRSVSLLIASMLSSLCNDKFVFSFSKDAAIQFLSHKMEQLLTGVTLEESEAKALCIASFLSSKEHAEKWHFWCKENTKNMDGKALEDFGRSLREGDVDIYSTKDVLLEDIFRKTFPYFSQCFEDSCTLVNKFIQ
ncbi:hypothetical protein GAYE_PCTG14G0583 [Galdieria yellowstonensis]|uniref:Uncharacterized protein n=1 Tax=Galdieria yellowstonensis TaxID=3028027 RepID=A0AAV9I2T9_9RHOD|nr:hypothetical protein GAYE_PCTG14G0583 [Galdieria yellowstonensis]